MPVLLQQQDARVEFAQAGLLVRIEVEQPHQLSLQRGHIFALVAVEQALGQHGDLVFQLGPGQPLVVEQGFQPVNLGLQGGVGGAQPRQPENEIGVAGQFSRAAGFDQETARAPGQALQFFHRRAVQIDAEQEHRQVPILELGHEVADIDPAVVFTIGDDHDRTLLAGRDLVGGEGHSVPQRGLGAVDRQQAVDIAAQLIQ